MITKGERTELRSIVRQQFRVLRSEVVQRQLEMAAQVETDLAERYADGDAAWQGIMHEIHEATLEANRRVNDALNNAGFQVKGNYERVFISCAPIQQPTQDRMQLRHLAQTRIAAQVKAALLRLEREEADLLRTLAVGAIESDEARQFLERIPTVGELVSVARLAELEASLGSNDL